MVMKDTRLVVAMEAQSLKDFQAFAEKRYGMNAAQCVRFLMREAMEQNLITPQTFKQSAKDKIMTALATQDANGGEIDISVPEGKAFDAQLPWLNR